MFGDDKTREQVEHNYGFSGSKIEEYSTVLENKLDAVQSVEDQDMM